MEMIKINCKLIQLRHIYYVVSYHYVSSAFCCRKKRKERKQQRREGGEAQNPRKRLRRELTPSSLRLVVDCSFDNLMLIKVKPIHCGGQSNN